MAKSIMEQIALLPPEEQDAALEGLDPDEVLWDWHLWGRPEQIPPKDDSWRTGLFLAGRGAGKTRAASEWIREMARETRHGKQRFLLVGRTAADVRQVMITGDSGILDVSPPSERPDYRPSNRELIWPNGNTAFCTSADEPDGLRGVQAHKSWGDEIAAWRQAPDGAGMTAWDNLRVATRLGDHPQVLATTTPKRVPILFKLLKEQEDGEPVWVTRGSTFDNAGNLAGGYLDSMKGIYGGTKQEQQELYGEMLDAIEGALWHEDMIDRGRQYALPPQTPLRVIGVDPTVAETPTDECGIVVVASTGERDLYRRQAWVLEDASIWGAPNVWAQQVVAMARKWSCPVVAEVNQGHALISQAIHQIDPSIVVIPVHSKVGKKLRAEPVTLAYEQGRVHHIDYLGTLETQMVSWMPEDSKSPDRVDALVHALTALLINPPKGFTGGSIEARSFAHRRINTGMGGSRGRQRPTGGFRVR